MLDRSDLTHSLGVLQLDGPSPTFKAAAQASQKYVQASRALCVYSDPKPSTSRLTGLVGPEQNRSKKLDTEFRIR